MANIPAIHPDVASAPEGDVLRLKAEIASLQADLAECKADVGQRLDRVESLVQPSLLHCPDFFETSKALEEVNQITASVFGGDFSVVERDDCESDDRHFEIRVIDKGSIAETLARNHEWHRQLLVIPATVRGLFRLSIDAQD